MTKESVQRSSSLAILSAALLSSSASFASIVYDNSTTDLNRSYAPANGVEFGDQVFLTGTERILTDFRFETFLSASGGTPETAQLIFRQNNGPVVSGQNAPGTEFYRSATFSLGVGRQTVIANGFTIAIPGSANNFTWSVVLNGIDAGEQAGLLLYNPPTIGSSFDDFWQNNGGTWQTLLVDSGATPANFAAQITAIPEPGTLALGGLGALALVGYLGYKRRSV